MQRTSRLQPSSRWLVLLAASAVSLSSALVVRAVMPYNAATVTRVENKVSYGKVSEGRTETRPANPQDVVKASDFLLSKTDSRAELKYDDGTVVRIGQNTVFSFDANTRTLKLEKGTFVFYIPKGAGGGTIKTPTITAAVTGTTGKVAVNYIAVVEGEVTLVPGGEKVRQYQYAQWNADGSITIKNFDPATAYDGVLMTFNGRIGVPEELPFTIPPLAPPTDDGITRTQNLPNAVLQRTRVIVSGPTGGSSNESVSPY